MILLILLSISYINAITLRFKLKQGQQQCIKDQVSQNTLIYGNFDAPIPNYTFTLSIINQKDNEIVLDEQTQITRHEFHYVMPESGEIQMCFELDDYSELSTFTLNYDSGVEVYDFDQIAKKQSVFNINDTLNQMELLQQDISREQLLIVDREERRKRSFTDIQTKIIGFAGITFGLLIIVAACQVIYVRRFVIYKKLA